MVPVKYGREVRKAPVAYRQRPGHERRQLLFQSTEIHNYRFTIVVFAYALKIRFKIEFSTPETSSNT